MLSKSQLIAKVADENEGMSKKQVKGVMEALTKIATKSLRKMARSCCRGSPSSL